MTAPRPPASGSDRRDPSPNYITREGAKKLQEEFVDLLQKQRPRVVQDVADAAAQGDRSENAEYIYGKRKLREIDRRIQWLTKRLESATVVEARGGNGSVPPAAGAASEAGETSTEAAFFGAFVEVEDENGARACYRIVGEDEIDTDRGHISWRSPLGRALLKKRAGDAVVFRRPAARPELHPSVPATTLEVELTVVSVRY
jgi:transcription elongation factor GreB